MDPTSFAVGVVSMAGLVSTCIEAFQILRSIKAFNRDTQILFTKLDIEKERFLQWAQQVGLLKKHSIDRRLFNKRTDLLINRVLEEIRFLLDEALGMEGKYGQRMPDRKAERRTRRVGYYYGEKGRRRYEDESESERDEKKVSFGRKFIWTVHGRDELRGLIDELGYFVGKLYEMIPSIEQRKASLKELKECGANAATLSTLMLAEARTDSGIRHGRSEDGDWSDLASEVAGRAEKRLADGRRSRHERRSNSEEDGRRNEEPRKRRSDKEYDNDRRYPRGEHETPTRRRESSVSEYSDRSERSRRSTDSYRSSRSTLVDMFGDMMGSNGRPVSTFR